MPITHITPAPQTQDGFYYATNNPYQLNGPRGFTEFRYLEETTDMFVRLDFPGIVKDSVKLLLDPSKKAVIVIGDAPKEHVHDSSGRKYGAATGLVCDCCEISDVQCFVGDGVVRLILSKKEIDLHGPSSCGSNSFGDGPRMANAVANLLALARIYRQFYPADNIGRNPQDTSASGHPLAHLRGLNPEGRRGTDPLDPSFTGPVIVPHPSVLEGPNTAYETKQFQNGGLFLRIDMPGVPRENFTVTVEGGDVTVIGLAPPAMHDSSGRYYGGKVAVVPADYDCRLIKKITKHGVIRIIIPAR
ncbi:hypothetical protein AALP_AA8G260700 [Arabis alpina]|uniref:SHSP domain-containing protein n=1 Tax=Arabis alpina TaxID=50452 RepID=A0A087G9H5_ARAAL|nr:hypothetical protein AALP_AA8G260700 [Arabis alpina]